MGSLWKDNNTIKNSVFKLLWDTFFRSLKNYLRKWFFKEPWFERFFMEPEMVLLWRHSEELVSLPNGPFIFSVCIRRDLAQAQGHGPETYCVHPPTSTLKHNLHVLTSGRWPSAAPEGSRRVGSIPQAIFHVWVHFSLSPCLFLTNDTLYPFSVTLGDRAVKTRSRG